MVSNIVLKMLVQSEFILSLFLTDIRLLLAKRSRTIEGTVNCAVILQVSQENADTCKVACALLAVI